MAQLVVVRHGQASLQASFQHADYDELSPRGREQATALGRHLGAIGARFDAVFTGPARRHHDTATLAGEAMQQAEGPWPAAVEVPELDEHDAFSLLRGAASQLAGEPEVVAAQQALLHAESPAERSQRFQVLFEALMHRWLRDALTVEGVETWPAFRDRVRQGLEVVLSSGARRPIAFSSVGPLAVMLQRALGTDDATSFRTAWRLRNASLTTFVFDGRGRFSLDGFNALPHLPDPTTWTFR